MQRLASMSVVVKANGISEALYNGQRDRVVEAVRHEMSERIRQAKAEIEVERDRADINARNCNRFRAEKLASMQAQANRRPGLFRRIANGVKSAWALVCGTVYAFVSNVWCYLCAYTIGGAWLDALVFLKMVEIIDDEGAEDYV